MTNCGAQNCTNRYDADNGRNKTQHKIPAESLGEIRKNSQLISKDKMYLKICTFAQIILSQNARKKTLKQILFNCIYLLLCLVCYNMRISKLFYSLLLLHLDILESGYLSRIWIVFKILNNTEDKTILQIFVFFLLQAELIMEYASSISNPIVS